MANAQVLVVDDNVTVRRLLSKLIDAEPGMVTVGSAPNGNIGLAKIDQLAPNLVVLDIEMPEMDGLKMISEIRKSHPRLPILVFSSHTERGAEITIDSLLLGASDYVTKPSQMGSRAAATEYIRDSLLPRIRALAGRTLPATQTRRKASARAKTGRRRLRNEPARVHLRAVGIGISTGGPNALVELVPDLGSQLSVPVFIAQHMPPIFTAALAARLDALSDCTVRECDRREPVGPGEIWIARGHTHMTVKRQGGAIYVEPVASPEVESCRPSVNVLFQSLAEVYGEHVLGVVMTGMGNDGLTGSREICDAGGQVIVQDQASSVVWGMPGAVEEAGLAQAAVSLGSLGREIVKRTRGRGRASAAPRDRKIERFQK